MAHPVQKMPAEEALIHLFHLNGNEIKKVTGLHRDFDTLYNHYLKNAVKLKTPAAQNIKHYVAKVQDLTKKSLEPQNPKIALFGNYFINELQCDFVILEHEEKMKFMFHAMHQMIDNFIHKVPATAENQLIKEMMARSNYNREHAFDHADNIISLANEIAPVIAALRL